MNNNRLYKRFSVDTVGVYGMMMSASEIKFLDISVGGISFLANRRFELDRECSLKLGYDDKVMTLDGIVIWTFLRELRPGPRGMIPFYQVGIKFKNCMNERMSDLADFINRHATEELHKPCCPKQNARIFDGSTNKTSVDDTDGFTLRKLGLNSIVVESQREVEINKEIPLEVALSGERPLKLIGRVSFCFMRMNASRKRYDIRMEILDMSMDDRKRLLKFVSSYNTRPIHMSMLT